MCCLYHLCHKLSIVESGHNEVFWGLFETMKTKQETKRQLIAAGWVQAERIEQQLGIAPSTLNRWSKEGLRVKRIGRKVWVKMPELESFIKEKTTGGAPTGTSGS